VPVSDSDRSLSYASGTDAAESLPLDEMTAAANLFPQAHHASTPSSSLALPLPVFDTTLTSNSGLDFFAMADYNLNSAYNRASDETDDNNLTNLNIDYHSSDQIFDHFNATFGSLDGA
jgi:hypothetical protein